MRRILLTLACVCGAVLTSCSSGGSAARPSDALVPAPDDGGGTDPARPPAAHGWVVVHRETFDATSPKVAPAWAPDPVPDDGPFADHGLFFQKLGVVPPAAYRASAAFGEDGWLTVESYTRSPKRTFAELFSVATDPADPSNTVLRLASSAHTDGTVVRPTAPLPQRYRISLRVGYADFGDGKPGLNGYEGGEIAEPWSRDDATTQNGFYWLTILDAAPRPHNNTWIHHHRKVVVDSDNNVPPWMQVFDGSAFRTSGERPIMMFAVDGKGQGTERAGKPFLSYAGGAWQPSGAIRAVDSYLPGQWYRVSIERTESRYTLEISGRFRYGGQTVYRATIDAAANCVFHFNRTAGEDASRCLDASSYPSLAGKYPNWPSGEIWPDWFMFGDPHTNYYRGQVLYDDVQLEVWK